MERRPRVGDGDRCARETLNSLAVTEESDLLDGARPTGALTSPAHANSRQIPQFDLKVLSTRRRRIAVEAAVVLLVTTAFVCLLFWRLLIALGSTPLEPASDAPGTIGWLYAIQHEGGYHLFGTTHHTMTGAPFGWNESNGLNIQWLLPYYPAFLLTKLIGNLAHLLDLEFAQIIRGPDRVEKWGLTKYGHGDIPVLRVGTRFRREKGCA